jgi:hypothetical protein
LIETRIAATRITQHINHAVQTGNLRPMNLTGTLFDPVILEVNKLMQVMQQYQQIQKG